MASIYKKGSKIYISWFDWSTGKTKNRSTNLEYNSSNIKMAKKLSSELQSQLDLKKKEYSENSLVKDSTIKGAFEHFLKNNSHKHPKTIKDYKRFYKLFIQKYKENSPCKIVDKISVESWINTIKNLPYQQNTIHGYFKQCNHFLNFLFEYSYIPTFKINRSVKTRAELKEIIVFSDEDLKIIFENMKDKCTNFKTMIYLVYYTGLRSSDLLNVSVTNIDLVNQSMNYYSPKTKRYFTVPIHEALVDIIKERINEIKEGKLLRYSNYVNMSKAFSRYLLKINLKNRGYSLRTFRKTFITNASKVMDLSTVSQLVGHKQITTTAKYYNKVDLQRKRNELNKFKGIEGAQ